MRTTRVHTTTRRTTLKRALVAGAVAVTIGVPVGAYAATLRADTPDGAGTTASAASGPRADHREDCDAPDEVRAVLEDPAIAKLREDHQAEVAALREQRRADPDAQDRDAVRAEMTALRAEHRAEVLAAVKELDADAATWLQEHWEEGAGQAGGGQRMGQGMGPGMGQGFGQAGGGQGMGAGGARHGGGFGGRMGQHTTG